MNKSWYDQSYISTNFNLLSEYHPDWSLDEIMVFEQMLVLKHGVKGWVIKCGNEFLQERLHLSRRRVENAVNKLIQRKLITRYGDKAGVSKMYKIDGQAIQRRVDKIWNLKLLQKKEDRLKQRSSYRKFILKYLDPYNIKGKVQIVKSNEDE